MCFNAFQIAAVIEDKARAKVFAKRAYAARKVLAGNDNLTTVAFKLSNLWTALCMVRGSIAGTIARRLLRGYVESNLKTGSGIQIDGRDVVPFDKCDTLSGSIPEFLS